MTSVEGAGRLSGFLDDLARRSARQHTPAPLLDAAEPILGEFVRSFLIWESTTAKAAAAAKRIEGAVVDFNELRVCLPEELVGLLGERYPRAGERAQRLRASLHELFVRHHAVSLEHLAEMPKREAYVYLESLEGVPAFVAARVHLLCLGGHSAPVDSRIAAALSDAGLIEPGTTAESVAGMIERRIRAGELASAYLHLQHWADEGPGVEARASRGARAGPKNTRSPARRSGEGRE